MAAIQKLVDEAPVSGDPSAQRDEAILRHTRPLTSSVEFGDIIIRLVGSKEESEVANWIAKMSRQRGSSCFHPYARWSTPQRSSSYVRGVPPRGSRRGCGVFLNCGQRGHFQRQCTSFLS